VSCQVKHKKINQNFCNVLILLQSQKCVNPPLCCINNNSQPIRGGLVWIQRRRDFAWLAPHNSKEGILMYKREFSFPKHPRRSRQKVIKSPRTDVRYIELFSHQRYVQYVKLVILSNVFTKSSSAVFPCARIDATHSQRQRLDGRSFSSNT
jgi:hypothetical protein